MEEANNYRTKKSAKVTCRKKHTHTHTHTIQASYVSPQIFSGSAYHALLVE